MTKVDAIYAWVEAQASKPGVDIDEPMPSIHALIPQFKASKATVEKALNRLVADGVLRAVHGKGYYPVPPLARAGTLDLAMGPTQGIFDGRNYHSLIFSGIAAAGARIGRDIRIFSSLAHGGGGRKDDFFASVGSSRNLFGVLTLDMHDDAILLGLRERQVPTVSVDHDATSLGLDSVVTDSQGDARELTRLLIGRGHRTIACLATGGRKPDGSFIDPDQGLRIAGYRDALTAAGLPFSAALVIGAEASDAHLAEAVAALAAQGRFSAALLDFSEVRHLREAFQAARRPPELAILGDRQAEIPAFVGQRIFAAYDFQEMGRRAVEILVRRIQEGPGRAVRDVVQPVIQ